MGFQRYDGKHSGNCSPQPGYLKNRNLIAKCKSVGKDRPFSTANAIDREIRPKEVPTSTPQEHIINKKNLAKRINYARKDNRVRPPKRGEVIGYIVRVEYFPANFYRGDVVSTHRGKTCRHFIFMTDEQIHLALNTDNVLIDATFKIVACAHDQLFTIHSNVKIMGQEHRVY